MCTRLSSYLVDVGYDIHIISFVDEKKNNPFFPISDKVKLYKLLTGYFEIRIHHFMKWLGYAERKYKWYIKKHHIDLIIDVGTSLSPFTSPIANSLDIKYIAWDHFCYKYFLEHQSYNQILPCLKNGVDKLVVLTDKDYHNYVDLAEIPAEKVVHIYNFSAIEEYAPTPHEAKRVLAMGRLQRQKGFDLLLQAWSIVEKSNDEWSLEIVGDGPEYQNLLDLVANLKLKRVVFSPTTDNPRLKYENSSIFVLSSRFEGLGLVIMEAANMSLPIISFDCENGPNELIIDGYNGYLIPAEDTEKMAKNIIVLINNPELRKNFGQNAFNSMQKYRKEIIVRQWIELIESI